MQDKKDKIYRIVMAAILIAAGLLLAVFPENSARLICYGVGALLVIAGAACLVAFFTSAFKATRGNDFVTGIVCAIAGLLLFARPETVTGFLTIIFGVVLIADGATGVQKYILCRRAGIKQSVWTLMLAIVSLVLGAVMAFDPFGTQKTLMLFAGISLIVDGALDLAAALLIKNDRPPEDKVIDLDDDDIIR